ncbi:hypothetical protein [Nocardia amamiensis]|uniref:hypothetical protein n=1 Tax=Nocardia amamiensis TaxID=404578 RepID=UPI000B273BE2|nr:hypothetical protein [Nocardia amamiensis]
MPLGVVGEVAQDAGELGSAAGDHNRLVGDCDAYGDPVAAPSGRECRVGFDFRVVSPRVARPTTL